jgi:hypothetical protein
MTAPLVSTLPAAPSRLSRPNNFVSESAVFLEALPAFRTQVNQLATYINANIPNKWSFGKLNGIRSFPTISQTLLVDIEYNNNNGIEFTGDLDALYSTLETYSNNINAASDWYDGVVAEVGLGAYDLDKPLVSGITATMNRGQDRTVFNSTADMFSATSVDNINSLYQAIWHTYQTSAGNRSFGSITDTTIITTINGGSITDTNLTY